LDAVTGLATTWNPNASGAVFALAVSDSTVYAGGNFTTIGGQIRNNIAALDATTGLATTWNPNANAFIAYPEVRAIVVSDRTVYAGGTFTTIGGQIRNNIAALDATTGLATTWNPNASGISSPNVRAIAVSDSTVYVGGVFTSIGGQTRNYIAALDATTGLATTWNPNANFGGYNVYALAVSGSTVYAGGNFTRIGGVVRTNFVGLSADESVLPVELSMFN
jgi:trimeric autotransporter adhesin